MRSVKGGCQIPLFLSVTHGKLSGYYCESAMFRAPVSGKLAAMSAASWVFGAAACQTSPRAFQAPEGLA